MGSASDALTTAVALAVLRLRLPRMMREQSLPDLLAVLTPPRRRIRTTRSATRAGIRVAEGILARLRVSPTCLYRSLARYAVLRRAGRDVHFVMGFRPAANDEPEGHAWLDGDALGLEEEGAARSYTVSFTYPET